MSEQTVDIAPVFVDEIPAPGMLCRNDFEPVVDVLRRRPGVWARVAIVSGKHWYEPVRDGGLVNQLRRHGCEVRTRADKATGSVHVFARLVTS